VGELENVQQKYPLLTVHTITCLKTSTFSGSFYDQVDARTGYELGERFFPRVHLYETNVGQIFVHRPHLKNRKFYTYSFCLYIETTSETTSEIVHEINKTDRMHASIVEGYTFTVSCVGYPLTIETVSATHKLLAKTTGDT